MKRLKRTLLLLGWLIGPAGLDPTGLYAAVPPHINLQGRLTNPEGNPIQVETQVDFFLYQGGSPDRAEEGQVVYKERAIIKPDLEGTYQHFFGAGTPLEGHTLTPEDFDTTEPVFLQVVVGGTPLLPRLQLVSAPYAFVAKKSLDVQGMIAMFNQSCPAGWTRFSQLDNRFPLGVPTYSGPGGSAAITGLTTSVAGAHTHTIDPHTHSVNITTDWEPVGNRAKGDAGGWPTSNAHDHKVVGDTGSTGLTTKTAGEHGHTIQSDGSWRPPYLGVVFCQKD